MIEHRKFLSEAEVQYLTSLGRTTRWRMIRNGQFPASIQLTKGRNAWLESEVLAWMAAKVEAR